VARWLLYAAGMKPSATASRARDLLIAQHMPMARRIARKVLRRMPDSVREDDLVSAAFVGLTEAAERFDAARGEPFVAFAAPRIRGAVLDELRRGDVMPRRVRSAAKKVGEAVASLERRLGRAPEDTEVAGALGVPVETYRAKLADLTSVRMVELPAAGGAWELPDTSVTPAGLLERAELTQRVRAALDEVPERDALVLSLYYVEELSYAEIGEVLGVSESRVCQLHARAIKRVREVVGE
jgi:RNA polymerase sigma factor for flagellar operon FliA